MPNIIPLILLVLASAFSIWSGANILVGIGCTYLAAAAGVLLAKGEET